jgi:hypothetical protein
VRPDFFPNSSHVNPQLPFQETQFVSVAIAHPEDAEKPFPPFRYSIIQHITTPPQFFFPPFRYSIIQQITTPHQFFFPALSLFNHLADHDAASVLFSRPLRLCC